MSIIAAHNLIGNFVVGSGGGASSAWPVISITREARRTAPDGASGESMLVLRYTIESVAEASGGDPLAITAMNNTLRATLARSGQQIAITERGVTETIGAEGTSGGPRRGFPKYRFLGLAEGKLTIGPYQAFTLEVEAEIPINGTTVGAFTVHSDDRKTVKSYDERNRTTTEVSGTVRVANGQSAESYVQTHIFTPAETAAESAGRVFSARQEIGNDGAESRYTYTDKFAEDGETTGGGDPVTLSNVTDVTTVRREGRTLRVIRGYAEGAGATAFADGQRPSVSGLDLLITDEISAPSTPDGRVEFSFEVLKGFTDAGFSGIVIYRFEQQLAETQGGRRVNEITYDGAPPLMILGPIQPYTYTQRDILEFTGTVPGDLLAYFPDKFDSNARDGLPLGEIGSGEGNTTRLTVTRTFKLETRVAPLPARREVQAL